MYPQILFKYKGIKRRQEMRENTCENYKKKTLLTLKASFKLR